MTLTGPRKQWHKRSLAGGTLALLLALALIAWGVIDTYEISENSGRYFSKRSLAKPSENLMKKFLSSHSSQSIDQSPDQELIFVRTVTAPPPLGVQSASFTSSANSSSGDVARIYEWEAWGEKWVLRLWGDTKFLAPTFLVRREGTNDSWVERPDSKSQCFFRGTVEGVKVSDVALNACEGLSGVIRVGELVYFIEPSDYRTAASVRQSDTLSSDSILRNETNHSRDGSRTNHSEETIANTTDGSGRHILSLVSSSYLKSNHDAAGSSADTRKHSGNSYDSGEIATLAQDNRTGADSYANLSVSEITGSSYISRIEDLALLSLLSSATRSKRFIFSRRHTIEVMVVVDHKMVHYHGKNVDQYVLTLMSVVSLIFRDSSIGNNIDIAVVEVVKPEGKSFAPKKAYENYAAGTGKSAEEMLKMFCKWQKQSLKYNAEHPHRYDTALLITRENICRNPYTQRCDTLGLAELGTMCSRYASCAIVQDNGLSAAFTIAHELGHLLNMPHDNDDKCSPFRGSKQESQQHMNVMSRMLDHNTLPWIWSNCSRYYLTEYFLAGLGECMEDEPWSNKIAEDDVDLTLAGELFSAAQQCQYVFGKTSSICPYMPKCKRLWCTTTLDEKEGCRTQHMPWADGTPCDKNRWCLRGECVPKNRVELRKIEGDWGAWQPWSTCSRSCGVGVRRSERFCDSPKPQFGGHFCIGERVRYESCKLRDCPKGSLDFRSQQCKQFNGKNFGLPDIPENVKWLPKYADRREDSCKLFCQAHNSGVSYQLKEKVEDGTPCGPDTYDICVSGKCRVAGCDYVLNSTLKDDWCGVCNGDNTTCQLLAGALEEVQPWGYSSVVVIPEGAARINIVQKSYHDNPADDNYLALVDYETGEYLLNGNWVVTPFEKLVEFGGSLLEYTGSNHAIERINSTKPLQKKLLVQILSVGKLFPPFVSYTFSKSNLDEEPGYAWKLGSWSECSRPCIGHSEQTIYCIREDTNARVADHHCNETEKPIRRRKSCSLDCSVHWNYTKWNACSLDEGKRCVKKRIVESCVTSAETKVEVERCSNEPPVTEMDCQKEECPVWKYSEWSPCHCPSNTHVGQQKRLYACYMRERPVSEWECKDLTKPTETRNCPCWYAGEWGTECVVEESETVLELKRRMEEVYAKPSIPEESHERNNSQDETYDSRAFKSPYIQKATVFEVPEERQAEQVSCQQGKKRREIICGPPYDPRPDHMCDMITKPSEVSFCQVPCAPITTTTTYKSTIPFTILKATTPYPKNIPHSAKLTSYSPEETSKDKSSEKYRNKLISKGSKGLGVGGYIKGGKKEKERLRDRINQSLNEIENSLIEDVDQTVLPQSNEIHGHQSIYRSRTEEFDSGEEENNNLVKGRQNLDHHLWQTGKWNECSKECGGGERRRLVYCGGLDPRICPADLKPKDWESCNTHPCTEWTHGDWGLCHPTKRDPCRGKKHRIVICRNSEGRKVNPLFCLAADRPQSEASCRITCDRNKRLHNRYKWRKGPWSPCSESCDGGVTTRNVTCIDNMVGRIPVHDDYCLRYDLPRPRSQKRCNNEPCPFRWVAGEWPQCSWKCGPGVQKREISCHRVSPLRWVDPDPVDTGCRKRKMPPAERPCNLGTCTKGFFWVTRPWKPCQAPCGSKGRQRRSVICVDFKGTRAQRTRCSRTHRPRRKQKCRAAPCGFKSCDEARGALGVTVDGEYSLLVGGLNMSIFCYGMNTTEPREYLTLPAGEEGNFAEIYDKRLLRPDTCPFNGERSDRCNCVSDESGRAGLTTFAKIRLNTTSLAVNTFDFTFARVIKGRLIAYGEAGDCYSTTQCPQGSFSINLAGTSLRVSERTTWKGHGNKAAHWINRLDDSQRIFGRCGGYCGTCTPDPVLGLKFDIRITEEMMNRKQ